MDMVFTSLLVYTAFFLQFSCCKSYNPDSKMGCCGNKTECETLLILFDIYSSENGTETI